MRGGANGLAGARRGSVHRVFVRFGVFSMAVLADSSISTILQSYDFFPGTNFTVNGGDGAVTPTDLALDELLTSMPFELYDRDPLAAVTPSRPGTSSSSPAGTPPMLPGQVGTIPMSTGAQWFTPGPYATPGLDLTVQTSVDATYETASFRRIASTVDLDRFQQQLGSNGATFSRGPDVKDTVMRLARLALLRQLGRSIVNGLGATPYLRGLAGYYDGLFGGTGSDPQTIAWPGSVGSLSVLPKAVRLLMRQVSASGAGFGVGPNALVMSRRMRDALINESAGQGINPEFRPSATGEYRFHFLGVPVYVAPVREDELDSTSSPDYPTYGATPPKATSIYALRLGGPTGVRVLHAGGDSSRYGVEVEDLAGVSAGTVVGYRLHGNYALFVPERQACARLFGVPIDDSLA